MAEAAPDDEVIIDCVVRVYIIYDFTVAFVVPSLENLQGSSDEEIEETADESAPIHLIPKWPPFRYSFVFIEIRS